MVTPVSLKPVTPEQVWYEPSNLLFFHLYEYVFVGIAFNNMVVFELLKRTIGKKKKKNRCCVCFWNISLFYFVVVVLEDPEEKNAAQFRILKQKLEDLGLECDISVPGQFNHLICPMVFCSFRFVYYAYFISISVLILWGLLNVNGLVKIGKPNVNGLFNVFELSNIVCWRRWNFCRDFLLENLSKASLELVW